MRYASLVLAALSALGCSLLHDPCGDLEERLCADLGSDCSMFQSDDRIRRSVLPDRRRRAEQMQCEMFVADENYDSYTLPFVRHQIEGRRNPSMTPFDRPPPHPVDGLFSGVSCGGFYLLPFLVIGVIFLVGYRSRRQIAAAQAAQAGAGPPPGSASWDHVDSREAAAAQAATGLLVRVHLLPLDLGGIPVPENEIFVTPRAAQEKEQLDASVRARVAAGERVTYSAQPEYRGRSFVPSVLVVHVGEGAHRIHVW